jgi:hypothetical protein
MNTRNIAAAVLILALVCLFFHSSLAGGEAFFFGDNFSLHRPYVHFLMRELGKGSFPLWNPHVKSGVPFLADPASGALYPLTYLSFVMKIFRATTVMVVAEVFLAAFFLYLFLRELGLRFWASIVGGISFAFSGAFLLLTNQVGALGAFCWIGAVFYFFEKSIRQKRAVWAVLAGCFLALSILAGDVHASYMVAFALFLYFLFRLSVGLITRPVRALRAVLLHFCIVLVFAGGLSAVQLVPSFELSRHAVMGHGGSSFTFPAEMPPAAILNIFFPKLWGSVGEGNIWNGMGRFGCYFGMVGLVFALLSVYNRKQLSRWFFFAFTLLSLTIALGAYGRLYYTFFHYLPTFRLFANPGVFLLLFCFAGSVSAAIGVDGALTAESKVRRRVKSPLILALIVSLIGLVSLQALSMFHVEDSERWLAAIRFLTRGEDSGSQSAVVIFRIVYWSVVHGLAALAGVSFFGLLYSVGALPKRAFALLLVVITCVDLLLVGGGFVVTAEETVFSGEPESVSEIPAGSPYRIAATGNELAPFWNSLMTMSALDENGLSDREDKWEVLHRRLLGLPDNEAMMYGLYTAGGRTGFTVTSYARFMQLAVKDEDEGPRGERPAKLRPAYRDFLNIRYLISDEEMTDESLKLLATLEGAFLYENEKASARAFFVEGLIAASDEEEAFRILTEREVDFSKEALIEGAPKELPADAASGAGIVLGTMSPNRVSFEFEGLEKEAFCVVVESYYPGWRAFADGKEIPIYRTNGAFRGVFVPAGTHSLVMKFSVSNFRLALVLSLFFVVAFLLAVIWSFIGAKRRAPTS